MYCPEADRGGGEGAGAEAEVDDGVLPASDADHLDGLRRPRSATVRHRRSADPGGAAAAPPRGRGEAERRRERDQHQAASDGGRHGLDAAGDEEA